MKYEDIRNGSMTKSEQIQSVIDFLQKDIQERSAVVQLNCQQAVVFLQELHDQEFQEELNKSSKELKRTTPLDRTRIAIHGSISEAVGIASRSDLDEFTIKALKNRKSAWVDNVMNKNRNIINKS